MTALVFGACLGYAITGTLKGAAIWACISLATVTILIVMFDD